MHQIKASFNFDFKAIEVIIGTFEDYFISIMAFTAFKEQHCSLNS